MHVQIGFKVSDGGQQKKMGIAGEVSISEGTTKDMLGFERAQVYLPF